MNTLCEGTNSKQCVFLTLLPIRVPFALAKDVPNPVLKCGHSSMSIKCCWKTKTELTFWEKTVKLVHGLNLFVEVQA